MIPDYSPWHVPNPYCVGSVQCPVGTCTYKDGSNLFVYFDDGTLHYADMMCKNNNEYGFDKVAYFTTISGDKHWHVERQHVTDKGCIVEILASNPWCNSIASRVSDLAMKRSTFDSIIKRFNTTPMGKNVIDIIEKSLCKNGYDYVYFDHVERSKKEPLLISLDYCSNYRKEIVEARKRWAIL